MKNLTQQKPTAIQAADIASVAQRGVERALAARQSMLELSSEQANDVSGGAFNSFLLKPIIAGGLIGPLDPYGPFGPRLPSGPFGAGGLGGKTFAV